MIEETESLGDLVVVPTAPVLIGEEDERAVHDTSIASRVLQQHQRQQRLVHPPAIAMLGVLGLSKQFVRPAAGSVLGPQRIDQATARDGHQPTGRVGRTAVSWPRPHCRLAGVRQRVLGEVHSPSASHQQRGQAPPVAAHCLGECVGGVRIVHTGSTTGATWMS